MPRGTLFLIVGPSGAGKDSLLRGAQETLAGDDDYVFARRVITRETDPEREDHDSLTKKEFAQAAKKKAFMAAWNAYDTDYGIPVGYAKELEQGRHVVANVSREAVGEIAAHYRPVCVIQVTAPADILEKRLAARGDEKDAARRLSRTARLPDHISVVHLLNAGSPEKGVDRMVRLLTIHAVA